MSKSFLTENWCNRGYLTGGNQALFQSLIYNKNVTQLFGYGKAGDKSGKIEQSFDQGIPGKIFFENLSQPPNITLMKVFLFLCCNLKENRLKQLQSEIKEAQNRLDNIQINNQSEGKFSYKHFREIRDF